MSFHIAALVTSEKCGHCRTMRGTGRLLSQNEIKKDSKTPTIPGGFHYDARFMKKMITADTDSAKLRIINVHYKSFNPGDGVMDLSVFVLEPDNKSIRQTILKEKNGKTVADIYVIGDVGKQVTSQDIPTEWPETVKTYLPVNLTSYAYFYPTLSLFHFEAWMNSIKNNEPIFGYVNGLETKQEHPYGAIPGQNPNPGDFVQFLNSFFKDGSKPILVKPEVLPKPEIMDKSVKSELPSLPIPQEKQKELLEAMASKESLKIPERIPENSKPVIRVPTAGACQNLNFRLYVKE
jgi:hypothetical protein